MALTKVTYSMIKGAAVNVLDYGVIADGTTNNTTTLAAALAAVPANGTLYFPAGVYCGYLLLRRSNITIMGDGSSSTILKLPNNCPTITVPHDGVPNPITGLPNVIEIGECALGNAANTYERVNVIGLTLDGNYTNNTAPTTDLFGHGMILTKTSNCFIDDVVAKNCYLTGVDIAINSNYNTVNVKTIDCGNSALHYPNFDINSSKYCHFNVISEGGYYGGRMLDNCWDNILNISVHNPLVTGVIYNNQSVNFSYTNIINAVIYDGCDSGQGMSVGPNCHNSTINVSISNVTGTGLLVSGTSAATAPSGNKFFVNTFQCGGAGVVDGEHSNYNTYIINSKNDGFGSTAGDYFAVDISGSYNQFSVSVQGGTPQVVRGLVFRAESDNNRLSSYIYDPNLVQQINELGTNNYINYGAGVGPDIASANAINVPSVGSYFLITGTTGIASIGAPGGNPGRTITLAFAASLTVVTSGNIKLAGNTSFTPTAGSNLTLISNDVNWIEISRMVV
jgi:hypothetical protein